MKTLRKVLSVVLAQVLILTYLPISVSAEDEIDSDENEITEYTEEYEPEEIADDQEIYVLGEVEENREESVKHFRMSDGSFTAAQFSEPVHFQDENGEWHNLDNTLSEYNDRYISINGDVTKSFSSSLADGELFSISYKDYSVGITYVVRINDIPVISEEEQAEAVQQEADDFTDEETGMINEENSLDDNEESESAAETVIENSDQEEEPEQADYLAEEEIETPETEEIEQNEEISGEPDIDISEEQETAVSGNENSEEEYIDTDAHEEEQDKATDDAEIYVPLEGTEYAVYKNSSVKAYIENPSEKLISDIPLSDALKYSQSYARVQYAVDEEKPGFLYESSGYDIKESILIHEKREDYSYSFMLELQGLVPELQDGGSILLKSETGEDIFEIPAPVLKDASGITSDAAQYTLENENGHWILTVEADPAWMNEEGRAFLVELDPTIMASYGSNTVYSTYVRQNYPNTTGSDQDMYCGYNDAYGECRIALQIAGLPSLPADCMPVRVNIAMFHAGYFDSSYIGSDPPSVEMLMEIHELNGGVTNIASQTWNTLSNKVNSKVIDYQKGRASTIWSYLFWNISSAALKWYQYSNTNRGLIITAPNAITLRQTANLLGSHFVSYSPVFIVEYRNATGLEDYYSYRQASAGRAGNVYISDYTNQLTAVHTDLIFSSEVTPFTLSHVYNSEHAKKQFSSTSGINTKDFSSMVIGSGLKLSAQQTIISKTIGDTAYLVFNDADGTDHYFRQEGNEYLDEDGLNLKITENGETYTMTDEDANHSWTFYNGYLISHEDLVGNKIYYAYNSNYSSSNSSWKPGTGNTNRLKQIVSVPVGKGPTTICSFGYTGNNLTSITDYAGRTITYSFTIESNRQNLKYIQYPDGNQSQYEYDSTNGWMSLIYDAEAHYGLEITQQKRFGQVSANRISEYTSLSGGESFIVSLALALGLSDVVQSHVGGQSLDTLFIDEGFGTLDDAVLDRAVEVLNSLSDDEHHLVGIISHVARLEESIVQKIVVRNSSKGSSLHLEGVQG